MAARKKRKTPRITPTHISSFTHMPPHSHSITIKEKKTKKAFWTED